jgi:hypothetical protein
MSDCPHPATVMENGCEICDQCRQVLGKRPSCRRDEPMIDPMTEREIIAKTIEQVKRSESDGWSDAVALACRILSDKRTRRHYRMLYMPWLRQP